MGPHQLEGLFDPQSVAVFGASGSRSSVGGQVFANLLKAGFKGDLYPINPHHKTVGGQRCYAAVTEVAGPVDLALVATPAQTVPDIFRECAEKGVRNVVVLSAGFGETGEEGRAMQQQLLQLARQLDIRFIGPNCVGLVRPRINLNASFLRSSIPEGNIALVSQSGALCSAIADWAEPNNLGLSALISLGNSVDVGFGDALSYLAVDGRTDAVLLYVESVSHARSFISELRATARLKPVIVLKSGRHEKSASAARTHTGALAGSNAAFRAALERAGAVHVDTFGQLFAAAEMLSAHHRTSGGRLAIITNGGGPGVLASDRAEELGVELPGISDKIRDRLDAILPAYWSHSNPVDILGDARPAAFREALEACLEDPGFDGALVMLTPQAMTDAGEVAKEVVDVAAATRGKPVLSCFMGQSSVATARKRLSAGGIADFTTPESAVEAFSYLAMHERNQRLAVEAPGPAMFSDAHDVTGARMIIEAALNEGRTTLSQLESKAVLAAFGIATNTTIEATSPTKALIAAETLGFPVAMKINSPQITHKSDVGGVRTNLMTAAGVRGAYEEMVAQARAARPDATIEGVTIETMAPMEHARELLIGSTRDPVFGQTIVFGAGGTMVEVLRDSAVALPPLTAVLAERLIARTRVSHLLDAFRNRPAVDRKAIVEILLRVSDMLVDLPHIVEFDINPLLAGPEGVIAVDARIAVERPKGNAAGHPHLAIAPYPAHLVETGYLPDGTPITIRPIRAEDAESEREFVHKLSPQAKHYRFMQAIKDLSPKMIARFTQIDYAREMAFVAIIEDQGRQVQIGVARYEINPDGKSCEFAIVVSDEKQHQGVGSWLMKALLHAAREHGLQTIEGLVLADNEPMLKLMHELAFTHRRYREDPTMVVVERRL